MKQITTIEDFKKIKVGEKVHKISNGKHRGLRLVGEMPGCDRYLIFSDGEHLEHLHFTHIEYSTWLIGKYDSKIVGKYMIEYHKKRIESIKKIYLK